MARFGFDLFELLHNLLWGIIIRRTQDVLSQAFFPIEQDRLDEFTGIGTGVKERHGRIGWYRQCEAIRAILRIRRKGVAGDVGHIEARHEEGGGDTNLANVLLHIGFAVKVVNLGEGTTGDWKESD